MRSTSDPAVSMKRAPSSITTLPAYSAVVVLSTTLPAPFFTTRA